MFRRLAASAAMTALAAVLSSPVLQAQTSCQDCHSDSTFATQDSAGTRSLFVTEATLRNSPHGGFACTDCHTSVTELPHSEKLPPVACGHCHEQEQADYDQSIHKKADGVDAPTCPDCHGTHDIRASADTLSMVNPRHEAFTCARCHSNPRLVEKYQIPIHDPFKAYQNSVHGMLTLTEGKDAATCGSCHGSHKILPSTDSTSTVARANVPKTCGQCHGEIAEQYMASVHGTAMARGINDAPDCNDCHSEHGIERARSATSPSAPQNLATQTCGRCHSSTRLERKYGIPIDRVSSFQSSYHGLALRSGNLAVANCASCHGVHNIFPSSDPRSTIAPQNLQKTCGRCHKDASVNFANGPVHLTGEEPPDVANKIVRTAYIFLIVGVIGGMAVHNGADFIRRSRRILKDR